MHLAPARTQNIFRIVTGLTYQWIAWSIRHVIGIEDTIQVPLHQVPTAKATTKVLTRLPTQPRPRTIMFSSGPKVSTEKLVLVVHVGRHLYRSTYALNSRSNTWTRFS
jgi:hypothetical protein